MLRELSIRSFALINEVHLTLGPGLTALVGETGAGKSIIIDALAAALGSRVSGDLVRLDARKAIVEATFSIAADHPIHRLLAEHELAWDHADLIIRREIASSGTSRCFVNDTPTTATTVRQLAEHLMDFHGQHDTVGLMDTNLHRSIIDDVGGLHAERAQMKDLYLALRTAASRVDDLERRAAQAEQEQQRIAEAIEELRRIQPQPDEDLILNDTLKRAEATEELQQAASEAYTVLYDDALSAHAQIVQAIRHLEILKPYHAELAPLVQELHSAATSCREAAMAVSTFLDAEQLSAEELDQLRQRYRSLQRLSKLYGSVTEACAALDQLTAEEASLQVIDLDLEQARRELQAATDAAQHQADLLSTKRAQASKPLTLALQKTLSNVGMPAAIVEVQSTPAPLGPTGAEAIEFLFTANAGEPPRPLGKVASGGELSRFMLALKKVQAASVASSLVFDEIDTGISGKIARKVGEEMRMLAERNQVICISHLPQIASLAATMIRVEKRDVEGRAQVSAEEIASTDMVVEVAKLISGEDVSEAALQSARELMSIVPTGA